MPANTNLQVQDLDFNTIKKQLINYLKGTGNFTDYDFAGSGLTALLDLLAYNTHYNGFYAHMLANEAFIDSASRKSSMTSKAKLLNYIPKSKRSAEAVVKFNVAITALNEPTDRKIVIKRGSNILSNNNAADARKFITIDDVIIYNKSLITGTYDYSSNDVLIYEGTFENERFIRNTVLQNQRFILRSTDIDINTLKIDVYDTRNSSNFVTYKLANDFMSINGDTPVFFMSVNEDDYYEIFFGNNVYGKALQHDNMVSATYVDTNGETGNNAKVFSFGGDYIYGGNPYTIGITTIANSEAGLESESIEELRFNIPYHYRRQNRVVTIADYKNILLAEYRNINSINVWGGEDNEPVTYGKVFISIKPLFGEVLSSKAKENIINNIIKKHNVVTVDVEIIDPEFLYINLKTTVRYNPVNTNQSSGQISSAVNTDITNYNTSVLNKFGSFYSDSKLNANIKASNPAILTSYNDITLEKRFTPALNSLESYKIEFLNQLVAKTIISDHFTFRLKKSYFADDGKGNIVIYWLNSATNLFEVYSNETFGKINYTTGEINLSKFEVSALIATSGSLNVYAGPRLPDFFTKRSNIVVINDVNISMVEDHENENER